MLLRSVKLKYSESHKKLHDVDADSWSIKRPQIYQSALPVEWQGFVMSEKHADGAISVRAVSDCQTYHWGTVPVTLFGNSSYNRFEADNVCCSFYGRLLVCYWFGQQDVHTCWLCPFSHPSIFIGHKYLLWDDGCTLRVKRYESEQLVGEPEQINLVVGLNKGL